MDLAFIIAVHNQNNLRLKNCLNLLLYQQTTHSYSIYIVDYASNDNLKAMLQTLNTDKVFYLSTSEDIGKPRSYNVAIRSADADIVCVIDSYCTVPMQTVESICTGIVDDTLLVYMKRPYFIPEVVWQDPNLTPADYEYYRKQATDWLDKEMQIGIGPSKKPLFAVKRQRLLEINGYDETLAVDEDVDIVRRLLQRGCVLTDLSQVIDIAYQPSAEDWADKPVKGVLEHKDVYKAESSAALWRNDPIRNIDIEWGQV